jgi:hypothetical protein
MARKGFLSWVGFSGESAPTSSTPGDVPTTGALERIRELESQLADLRSRKDITSLTREEFEILATETAMNLVKTAQSREKSASAHAARILSESSRIAQEATASAEAKAKTILATAESRGRKYLEAAQSESQEMKNQAELRAKSIADDAAREVAALKSQTESDIESMLTTKKREAAAITSSAKHEAEALVAEATASVTDYRNWLISAVSESERLYKIQTQSLSAAQQAIEQSRQRLSHAFEKLASLTNEVEENLDENSAPLVKEFTRARAKENSPVSESSPVVTKNAKTAPAKKSATKKSATKKPAAKKSSAKKAPARKVAKKSVAKKSVAKKSVAKKSTRK